MSQQTPNDPTLGWIAPGDSSAPDAAPAPVPPTQPIPAPQSYQPPAPPVYGGASQPPPPPTDPWSTPASASANPYATPAPGMQPPPGSFPTGYSAPRARTNVSAIVLLVLSVLALIPTVMLSTPAAIVAIVALSQNRDSPKWSRRLAWIGWGLLAASLVVATIAWWWFFDLFSQLDPASDPYSY